MTKIHAIISMTSIFDRFSLFVFHSNDTSTSSQNASENDEAKDDTNPVLPVIVSRGRRFRLRIGRSDVRQWLRARSRTVYNRGHYPGGRLQRGMPSPRREVRHTPSVVGTWDGAHPGRHQITDGVVDVAAESKADCDYQGSAQDVEEQTDFLWYSRKCNALAFNWRTTWR